LDRKTAIGRALVALTLGACLGSCQSAPFSLSIRSEELDRAEAALNKGEVGVTIDLLKGRVDDSMRGLKILGRAYMALAEYSEARGAFQRACALEPRDSQAWLWLGEACERDRYFDRALDAYRRGLQFEPKSEVLSEHLAILLADLGRLAEASTALRRALELDPKNNDLRLRLGAVELARGLPAEAEAVYDEVLRDAKDPDPQAFVGRGLARAQRGNVAPAVADLEQAASLSKDDADPSYNLGWIREEKLGDRAAAEAAYREALKRNANHLNAMIRLAGILNATARAPEALALYNRALPLAVDPRQKSQIRDVIETITKESDAQSRPQAETQSRPASRPL
jgi:tetratricopeptide (TPR) repeat protein